MIFLDRPFYIPEQYRALFIRVNNGDKSPASLLHNAPTYWNLNAKSVYEPNGRGFYAMRAASVAVGFYWFFIEMFSIIDESPKVLLLIADENDVLYEDFEEVALRRANIYKVFNIKEFVDFAKSVDGFEPLADLYNECAPLRKLWEANKIFEWKKAMRLKMGEMYGVIAANVPEASNMLIWAKKCLEQ